MLVLDRKLLFGVEFFRSLRCEDEVEKRECVSKVTAASMLGDCGGVIFAQNAQALIADAVVKVGDGPSLRRPHLLSAGIDAPSQVNFNPFDPANSPGIAGANNRAVRA